MFECDPFPANNSDLNNLYILTRKRMRLTWVIKTVFFVRSAIIEEVKVSIPASCRVFLICLEESADFHLQNRVSERVCVALHSSDCGNCSYCTTWPSRFRCKYAYVRFAVYWFYVKGRGLSGQRHSSFSNVVCAHIDCISRDRHDYPVGDAAVDNCARATFCHLLHVFGLLCYTVRSQFAWLLLLSTHS